MILVSFFWFSLAFAVVVLGDQTLLALHEAISIESVLGTGAVLCCFCYYFFPLSTISKVLRTKDSSSIEPNLAAMSVVNSSLWAVYGYFGLGSPAVYIPNFTGLALSIVQVGLILAYPAKAKVKAGETDRNPKTRAKSGSFDNL